jgi:hypothetical protein
MSTRSRPNNAPRRVLASALLLAAGFAGAADFYVDASAAAGGDGSQAAPYATIKEAVDAANLVSGEPSTIHVASGTYAITSPSDFATVTVPDLTIAAADPSSKPVVALDADLSLAQNNPVVFAAAVGADRLTVANLKFTFSYAGNKNDAGNSFGEKGRLFSLAANDCVVECCEFVQAGTTGRNWNDGNGEPAGGIVVAESHQNTHSTKGTGLVVRNCRFDHVGYSTVSTSTFRPIKFADNSKIVGNVFDTCSGFFNVFKQSSGGYFVSNILLHCTQPIKSQGDNYGEIPNGEIAYNVFVGSDVAFFAKNASAGYSGQGRFHHNTVVGCSGFVQVNDAGKISTWSPWIFDNLVVASETGCIIRENATSLDTQKSSFKEGSFFRGNAWLAPDFVSGTAPLQFDDYQLGLAVSDNKKLAVAPGFLDTSDPTSPDFYRLNAQRYPWVYTLAVGASGTIDKKPVSYAATYVGAVEPANIPGEPGEFFEFDRLSMDLSTNIVPATAVFEVGYTGNAGAVTVEWDFEGDGRWDRSGSAVSLTWIYDAPGDFHPKVRLTDSATSKTIVGDLASGIKLRMTDIYVDANAADGGNGTETAPLRSIAAAVPLCAVHGTIHVRGGGDRVYNIETADDLVVVTTERYLTITKWGEDRPRIVVASTLHSVTNDPSVISIPVGIVHTTISGLDFTYHGSSTADAPDSSLGREGRCIDVQGDYTTVDDCVFRQSGNYTDSRGNLTYSKADDGIGHAAVATRAQQNDAYNGRYLTVRRCTFLGESDDRSMRATRLGADSTLSENVFSNCCYVLWAVKNNASPFLIESNILYRCGTVSSGIYGNWNEFANAEFRYNIFWCDSGSAVPFITKNGHGLHENVLFHHNTIVNASHFAEIQNYKSSWRPRIFDNLIVLDPASADVHTVFKNNQTAFASGNYSSFKTGGGGCLRNNAWYATNGISGGAATQVAGYDLSQGCTIMSNVVLSTPPSFVSTKLESPDFCRPASRNGDWVGSGYAWTGEDDEYDDWIGAKPGNVARLIRSMLIIR